jgi:hypothetical protein
MKRHSNNNSESAFSIFNQHVRPGFVMSLQSAWLFALIRFSNPNLTNMLISRLNVRRSNYYIHADAREVANGGFAGFVGVCLSLFLVSLSAGTWIAI